MGKGRIRLISTVPGPANLGPIVREFGKRDGIVTAFSDSAIKMLASLASEDSEVEVIPFGSLVRRFATIFDELPRPLAQAGHIAAAIGVACEDLEDDSPFLKTASRLGLHRALRETLHELAEFGLSADEYEILARGAEPALAAKLRSLAQIESDSAEMLRTLGFSLSREHDRLCLTSTPPKGANLGRVLVVAGGDFRPDALSVLKWAANWGAQVTIVGYRHAAGVDIFPGTAAIAMQLGLHPELEGKSTALLRHLFANTVAEKGTPRAAIVSAADPLAEAEWALRACLVRHAEGMRFEEMAMYVRDGAAYAPLIESAAKRFLVPLRMPRRTPLLTNSFARLTRAALDFCASQDVRTVLPIAQTSYFRLGQRDRLDLGAAVREAYSARREQWNALRVWALAEQGRFPWLSQLLQWRDDAIADPAPLEGWIGKLRPLMLALPVDEATSERDRRASSALQRSLIHIASVRRMRGARSLTLPEFARLASEVWEESDVSLPAAETGVLVTNQADALPDVRCLFVLGMLEGVFPRRRSEDPILSDREREAISQLRGEPRLPISKDRAEAERAEFYAVCAAASDEIVLSYPETDEERDNIPAFYLDEVQRALGNIEKIDRSRVHLTPPPGECLATSDRDIRAALDDPDRAAPAPSTFLDPATPGRLARDPFAGLGPGELRDALQCPFRFMAARTLSLRPERLRTRWFSLVNLPRRAGLHGLEGREEALRALEAGLESELDSLYSEVPEWEAAFLRAGGRRLIREWVDREFASRTIWPREGLRVGVHFGEEGLRDMLPKIAKLKGAVAGLSRVGPYSVVHLIETSKLGDGYRLGDVSDEDRLYYGIHLLAAWEKGAVGAIDVETMAGERILILSARVPHGSIAARANEGLRVFDLAGGEHGGGQRDLFDEVKALAKEAARRIETADPQAIRGDHCQWCDYGELCRQSKEFGEEDSPFAADL